VLRSDRSDRRGSGSVFSDAENIIADRRPAAELLPTTAASKEGESSRDWYTAVQKLCESKNVRWWKRVGAARLEKMLEVTIQVAMKTGMLKPAEVTRVNVDTTVQEKAVAFLSRTEKVK
jgi:hypothetical protein